jgi:hypothetical protein
MILSNIIPENTWLAIKNYITNAVSTISQKAYLNYFDFSSNSVTTFTDNNFKKLVTDTTEGFSYDGLEHTNNRITNTGGTRVFQFSGIISVSGNNNDSIHMAFFKSGVLVPCSEQEATLDGNPRPNAIPIQCLIELSAGEYVEVWTKNANSTNSITLQNINVICDQM